ncbi:MAG: DUF2807 domain-containing protein, partial [Phaeodactylibacter sp.]|nr:DUF2807 domain-containing protein [Phaeodactylibacter sp.]
DATGGANIRAALQEGISLLGRAIRTIIDIIGRIARPLLIIICVFAILMLAIAWIASMIGISFGFPFAQFIAPDTPVLRMLGAVNILSIIGVPLLAAGLLFIRIAFGRRISSPWRVGLATFFGLNLISLVNLGIATAKNFNVSREISMNAVPVSVLSDTLQVKMQENPYEGLWLSVGPDLRLDEDRLILSRIELYIEKTDSDYFTVEQINSSRGRSIDDARSLAGAIDYMSEISGPILELPSYFILEKGDRWRDQVVKIKIGVPEGKTIQLSPETEHFVRQIDWNRDLEHPWRITECAAPVMGPGGLECPEWVARVNSKKEVLPKAFDRLRLEGRANVTIQVGTEHKVTMLGRADEFKDININTGGGLLDIYIEEGIRHTPQLIIETPSLHFVELNAEGNTQLNGFKSDALSILLLNFSQLTAVVDVAELTVRQEGHSKLVLRGEGTGMDLEMEDHAELDAAGYTVQNARIKAKEYSSADLHVLQDFQQVDAEAHQGEIRVQGLREVAQ